VTLLLHKEPSIKVNWLRERPIAHRGLHDVNAGIYENTLSAISAAMKRDYPVEFDLQLSVDKVPMVFHDEQLERMTAVEGNIREMNAANLREIRINGTADLIPSLAQLLELVDGTIGLVIEMKGKEGEDEGFVAAVVNALDGYRGNYVLMSFAHHLLEDARKIAPHIPLGLTAYGGDEKYETHREITEKIQADFISYYFEQLDTRFVREFMDTGRPVISWTVETEEDAELSARFADQPTFEGFLP